MKLKFYKSGFISDFKLKYVIICTRFNKSQWIFVRHCERITWEIPAGHIEPGELPLDAARRELYEETGTVCCTISSFFDYSVTEKLKKEYGRVFFAEADKLGQLPVSEIIEVQLSESLPEKLTYPEIQTMIFEKISGMI